MVATVGICYDNKIEMDFCKFLSTIEVLPAILISIALIVLIIFILLLSCTDIQVPNGYRRQLIKEIILFIVLAIILLAISSTSLVYTICEYYSKNDTASRPISSLESTIRKYPMLKYTTARKHYMSEQRI